MGRPRKGSIRENKQGRFEVRVAGTHVAVCSTEAEAKRKLKAFLNENVGEGASTFSAFAEDWWEKRELAAQRRKRLRSFKKDRSRWSVHVEKADWYDMPVKRISVTTLQAWIDKLSQTEAVQTITFGRGSTRRTEYRPTGELLSRKVIRESLNLVQLCFDAVIRAGKLQGLIVDGKITAGNPARMVLLPPEEMPEIDGELIVHLSKEEITSLFQLDLPAFQRAVFAVAIYAGLRRGELWGLRWQDLILDGPEPEVRIRRSYNGPTKTRNSLRDVPLLPPAVEALKAWRALQTHARIGAALVFPNEDGKCFGESYDAGWRDKPQRRPSGEFTVTEGWRADAGIRPDVTFQDLRHTCGCHLAQGTWLSERFDLHQIKTWLGHSSIAVTERHYARLTKHNLHSAVARSEFVGYIRDAKNGHTS